jgi:predicted cobalt transporter CbtA
MMKDLLVRGMLAGLVAGVLAFGFAQLYGEPQIEYAIGFEQAAEKAAHATGAKHEHASQQAEEGELVSRRVQATVGLLLATAVYGAGVGGLFAIVFALVYGRVGRFGPRTTSALLAAAGFVSIALVPFLKYPANPPGVGSGESLASRTSLFLVMIAVSIIALVLAIGLARMMAGRFGPRISAALGAVVFMAMVAIAQFMLPEVRGVPTGFSASELWHFRAASLGMQFLMWTTLGLVFGSLSAAVLKRSG